MVAMEVVTVTETETETEIKAKTKTEAEAEAEIETETDRLDDEYEVLVIGGGAAGLNGALMLARSRRKVAVIDAGAPRNAPAEGVHGLLARDGMPPAELLKRGRAEVRSYGGHVVAGVVADVADMADVSVVVDVAKVAKVKHKDAFEVTLTDGRTSRASRLLITTGLVDELPNLPGIRERWGRDVIHCPYCHGWEARDKAIGILGTSPMSVHQAQLFRQLSDNVVLFTALPLTDDQREQLAARDIGVVETEITALEVTDDRLTGVRLADGTTHNLEVIAIGPKSTIRADFLTQIGLHPTDHPSGMGEHIPADPTGRSTVPGIWLAGNVTDPSAQVGTAAAAGAMAGAQINFDLVAEETKTAVAAHQQPSSD